VREESVGEESLSRESAKKRWEWWTNARLLRWILVAILLLGAGLLPGLANRYEICREEVAQVGTDGIVRVCAPPSITDFPVVAGILLLAVLLAPDLSEVSIGVLSLKQKVATQEEKHENLKHEVSKLQLAIQNTDVRQDTDVSQELRAETIIQPHDMAAFAETIAALVRGTDEPKLRQVEPRLEDTDKARAQLDGEFLYVMTSLEFLAGTFRIGSTPLTATPSGSGLRGRMWRWIQKGVTRKAFPKLYTLIESRDDTKLRKVQATFREEFKESLDNLRSVRILTASGTRILDLEVMTKSLDLAGRMLTVLTLLIENVPAKPPPSAVEEQPAASVQPDAGHEGHNEGQSSNADSQKSTRS
jgi:hypothetical protein